MSYQEKKSLLSIFSNIFILGMYSLYIYVNYQDQILLNPNDLSFWGKAFFIFIPVSIVANIIIFILFHIVHTIVTKKEEPDITDERDKLIELKSIRISHWTFIVGFLLAMGSQAIGMEPWVMIITLVASGFVSACADEITKMYLYRRGF